MELKDINLDLSDTEFRDLLTNTSNLIYNVQKTLDDRKAFHGKSQNEIAGIFKEPLPQGPQPLETIMSSIEQDVIPNSTFNIGPYFTAYVLNGSNQVGMIGDFIASFLNQNTGKWHLASAGVEIERTVIRWIKEFLGIEVSDAGILVSGGSMANLTCLTAARKEMLEHVNSQGLFGQKPMTIYMSNQVHYCVYKAVEMLGIGYDQIRKIALDDEFRMDVDDLKRQIEEDLINGYHPFCVVGTAGTVNTGAIDPLEEIGWVCKEFGLWFHVDGAYGAPAAGTSLVGDLFNGLDAADSIAIDPHKWFYVPIEAGCALFKDMKYSKAAFSHVPDYLAADKSLDERLDYNEHGVQLSRGFKALKIWMTFKAYGTQKLAEVIEQDIYKAVYLKDKIEGSPLFQVMAEGPLSIVCYRFNPKVLGLNECVPEEEQVLEELNLKLLEALEKDGRVFITGTKIHGKTALRSCFVNHRTQKRHLDKIFEVLEELAEGIVTKVRLESV